MNKTLNTVLAAGALIVGVQQSQAISFRDAQTVGVTIAPSGSTSGIFNIVVPGLGTTISAGYFGAGTVLPDIGGFSPVGSGGTDTAVGGTAAFFVKDASADDNVTERIEVDLGAALFQAGDIPDGGKVIASGPLTDVTIIADINDNGLVTWTVKNTGESNVVLDHAILDVDAEREVITGTPDGGATAMLLGLGTLGLAAMRRKLS